MRLRRMRLALSVRALLLLVVAIALWLGWQVNGARRQALAVAVVQKYNGDVNYDYEFANGKSIPNGKPWAPGWLRRFLGEDYFRRVTQVVYTDCPISDASLAPLADLGGIEDLSFVTPRHPPRGGRYKPPPGLTRLTEVGLSRLEGFH